MHLTSAIKRSSVWLDCLEAQSGDAFRYAERRNDGKPAVNSREEPR
jgi:hypothetical protein